MLFNVVNNTISHFYISQIQWRFYYKKYTYLNKHPLRTQNIYCIWISIHLILWYFLFFILHVQIWRPELEPVKMNFWTQTPELTSWRKKTQVTSSLSSVSFQSKCQILFLFTRSVEVAQKMLSFSACWLFAKIPLRSCTKLCYDRVIWHFKHIRF